jgi:arylsulfatase A-like enzyme/tetratricopeptide (TPR) repeat protein
MAVLSAVGLAASMLAFGDFQFPQSTKAKRESGLSVLLVTIDTLRADAVGAYGGPPGATPFMDRLAAAGVRFERAHAHNVVTFPSHSNILAGRYPLDHGVRDNSGFRFPRETDTLATILKARGYRTAAFVSAFPLASRFGLDRGFDLYDDRFLSGGSGSTLSVQERHGPETVAAAMRWWESQGDVPKFVWLHLYEPHFPYEPPEPFASRYRDDPYSGEVAAADAALGPLLEPLLRAREGGRTLVVLTADHGESRGEHGERTHGIFAYEGPLRVPLVAFCPRLLAPRTVAGPVRHVDIAPTILDALALPIPEGLAGRSLLAVAAGHEGAAPPVYFEALSGMTNRRWAPLYGVIRDRMKYIDLPLPELFDLAADPKELHNLVASRPREVERLRGLLGRLRSADRVLMRAPEGSDTRERLRALGYVAAAESAPKQRFTEDDDPKRLIALEGELQMVTSRHQSGDRAGALRLCQEIVERHPQMPLALVQLASLQREAGRVDAAVRTARRALVQNPDDAETAALLGRYLSDAGRPAAAVALLEPFVEKIDPLPNVLMARGVALAQLGRAEEALAAFEQVRKGDPTNALALVNMGTVHLVAHHYGRARLAFEAALAVNPRMAQAHNSLGVIAAETGHADEAIERWMRAFEVDPRNVDTLFNLGSFLRRRGRASEARPYLESFLREAPPTLYSRDIARVRTWLGA